MLANASNKTVPSSPTQHASKLVVSTVPSGERERDPKWQKPPRFIQTDSRGQKPVSPRGDSPPRFSALSDPLLRFQVCAMAAAQHNMALQRTQQHSAARGRCRLAGGLGSPANDNRRRLSHRAARQPSRRVGVSVRPKVAVASAVVQEGNIVRVTFALEARKPKMYMKTFGDKEKEKPQNQASYNAPGLYQKGDYNSPDEPEDLREVLYAIEPPEPPDYKTGYEERDPLNNPDKYRELTFVEMPEAEDGGFEKPYDSYAAKLDEDYKDYWGQLPMVNEQMKETGGTRFGDGKGVWPDTDLDGYYELGQEEMEHVVKEEGELTFEVGSTEVVQRNALMEVLDGVIRGYSVGEVLEVECQGPKWTRDLCFEVPYDHPEVERLNARYKSTGGIKEGEIVELANGASAFVSSIYREEFEAHGTAPGPAGMTVEYRYKGEESDMEQTHRDMVRLDCNSPYCDKDLTIKISIEEIESR